MYCVQLCIAFSPLVSRRWAQYWAPAGALSRGFRILAFPVPAYRLCRIVCNSIPCRQPRDLVESARSGSLAKDTSGSWKRPVLMRCGSASLDTEGHSSNLLVFAPLIGSGKITLFTGYTLQRWTKVPLAVRFFLSNDLVQCQKHPNRPPRTCRSLATSGKHFVVLLSASERFTALD